MSESASRYQNALRYNPGRAAGTYLDAREVPDFGVRPVASRQPMEFNPFLGHVAQYGNGAEVQTVDQGMGGGGTNYLALAARYGPTAFKAANQAREFVDPTPISPNNPGFFNDGFIGREGPAADYFAYVGDDGHDLGAGFVDAGAGGGAELGAVGGVDGGAAAGGGISTGSIVGSGLDALGGAAGGWLGNYIGQMANNGLVDSTENGQIGATVGGIVGSFIPIPVVGTAVGAYFGGLIGSQVGSEPNMPSVYAQGFYGPDGNFAGSGVARGGGDWGQANALANIAPDYFAQRAAADGLAPNAGMAGQGYFFGGGAHDGTGGWFLQPNERGAGEVRPDLWGIYAGADAARGYEEGGGVYADGILGVDVGAMNNLDIRRPASFDEALNSGYDRLRDWGYFINPADNPSPEAAQARYDARYPGFTDVSANYVAPYGQMANFNAPGGSDGG